ncbi:hypothetical protein [Shewanella xiamenensis]|nr:hypothetical protein [Shewanella xiamenensis]
MIKHSHYSDTQQVRPCMLDRDIHVTDGHFHVTDGHFHVSA